MIKSSHRGSDAEAPVPATADISASAFLHELELRAMRLPGPRVVLGELLQGGGTRLYGLALMLFALPEAIPFPAVGLTGLVAIPIVVVSLSMLIWGMQGELPRWVRRRSIKREWVLAITRRGARLVRRIERLSHPRWTRWTEMGRPIGVLCIALSAVMAIPIPFSNVAPGVIVVAMGLGIFQRDGVLVILSAIAGLLILAAVVSLLVLGGRILL